MDERIKFFVGLDVHKDSTSIAACDRSREAARFVGTVGSDVRQVIKALATAGEPGEVCVVYEAGPTGFVLYWQLTQLGVECAVIAPTLVPKKPGDRVKTDRRDALLLARLARSGELTPVRVPSAADEAVRDLVRAREDAVREQRSARHRLKALLLRNGISGLSS